MRGRAGTGGDGRGVEGVGGRVDQRPCLPLVWRREKGRPQ